MRRIDTTPLRPLPKPGVNWLNIALAVFIVLFWSGVAYVITQVWI